jgi:hypothetical protein
VIRFVSSRTNSLKNRIRSITRPKCFAFLMVIIFGSLVCSGVFAQSPKFVSLASAQPVISAMKGSLPASLKTSGPLSASIWDKWVRSQDLEIRQRVRQGEENTLTNLMRLGVTFTKEPQITYDLLAQYGKSTYVNSIANNRADDLVRALAAPKIGEGMLEMRTLLEKEGYTLRTPHGRKEVKAYLLSHLARLQDDVARAKLEATKNVNQAFQDRGISTDSNLYPDYMIELHLRHMMEEGLLKPGSIHRVAIIGPGLDFVNKKSGSDFYPPQTTQPFAVIDSLSRLGLADPDSIEMYTFDISNRVNRHIAYARREAASGRPYTIQLLSSPSSQWSQSYYSGFIDYWQSLGDQVGKPVPAIPVPEAATGIWNRAIGIRPAVVLRLTPVDMNVVFQVMPLPPGRQFDLVIATNILIYYDTFQQSLARNNIGTMIKPGGYLLSNDRLPDIAPTSLKNSLQTSVLVQSNPPLYDYMYTYVRK